MASYWQKFGLTSDPFVEEGMECEPYFPARWQQQLDLLRHFSRSSPMALLVTGVSGSGKSVFMDLLFEQIEPASGVCKVHGSAGVTPDVLQELIVRHLGMPVVSLHEVNFQQRFMLQIEKMSQAREEFYLVIDNAQKLPKNSLALLIDMAEWQSNDSHPLHVILFGGPQLDAMMAEITAQHLGEAMTHTIRLDPFSVGMTREYIEHRMQQAGYEGEFPLTEMQLSQIHQASNGIPAKINLVARQVLLESEPQRQRKAQTKKDTKQPSSLRHWMLPLWAAVGAGAVVLVILFMVLYFRAPEEVVVKQLALRDEATAVTAAAVAQNPQVADPAPAPQATAVEVQTAGLDNTEPQPVTSVTPTTPVTSAATASAETQQSINSISETDDEASQYISNQFDDDEILPATEAESAAAVSARAALKTEVPSKAAVTTTDEAWIPLTSEQAASTDSTSTDTTSADATTPAPAEQQVASAQPISEQNVQPTAEPTIEPTAQPTVTKKPAPVKKPATSKSKTVTAKAAGLTQDEKYILDLAPNTFALQIAASVNLTKLKQFTKSVGVDGQVYYFRTVNAGKPWYVAVYGRYNSRAEAQQAIGNLPTQLLVKQKPWVRSFDNIQTAIKART